MGIDSFKGSRQAISKFIIINLVEEQSATEQNNSFVSDIILTEGAHFNPNYQSGASLS